MALYDFKCTNPLCPKAEEVVERKFGMSEKKESICEMCGQELQRKLTPILAVIEGSETQDAKEEQEIFRDNRKSYF